MISTCPDSSSIGLILSCSRHSLSSSCRLLSLNLRAILRSSILTIWHVYTQQQTPSLTLPAFDSSERNVRSKLALNLLPVVVNGCVTTACKNITHMTEHVLRVEASVQLALYHALVSVCRRLLQSFSHGLHGFLCFLSHHFRWNIVFVEVLRR